MSGLRALVLGGTGAVGKELVQELLHLNEYSKVLSVGRNKLSIQESEKFTQEIVDYDRLSRFKKLFEETDVVFCCLGTTRAKAGSAEEFRKVDHDYVLEGARLAKAANVSHFSLLTSVGANPNSWFLYPSTKGQIEEDIKALQFNTVTIFRPSFLLGRPEDGRIGEKVLQTFMPILKYLTVGPLSPYAGIHVKTVARAMAKIGLSTQKGVFIFDGSDVIENLIRD